MISKTITSHGLHGEPIVMSDQEAFEDFVCTLKLGLGHWSIEQISVSRGIIEMVRLVIVPDQLATTEHYRYARLGNDTSECLGFMALLAHMVLAYLPVDKTNSAR